jgi:signal transduction histidine kinase
MPISRLSFVQATLLMLLAGLIALVAIVGTTIWLVNRTQTYVEESNQARELRSAAIDLFVTMQNAETGQRGYLLTGDDSYLAPYDRAKALFPQRLARLEAAAEINVADEAEFARLAPTLNDKIAELQETIDLAKAGHGEEALTLVRTDRGKQLMDDARTILSRLLTTAEARLADRITAQRDSADTLWWAAIIGGLVILAVTFGGAWIIVRYTRDLAATQNEVAALNVGLEERVRERTADLARANDEVQRFAYIVTHDLRAPLVNIMGFTSELEASLGSIRTFIASAPGEAVDPAFAEARVAVQDDVPEALGFIRSSTRKMDGLINAILKLSREGRRALKPEAVDLTALFRAAEESLTHQLNESGGSIDIAAGVSSIVSDRLSLEQIIGNLLDNAVKYRSPERALRIKVAARPAPGNRVVITVEDNGRGIAEQDHERVFELFRRSGVQDTPGEGIGLAHVRTLVRNLGGDITLSSRFGQGTTFSIELPRDVRVFLGSKAA